VSLTLVIRQLTSAFKGTISEKAISRYYFS
jgi:hypothetical protein